MNSDPAVNYLTPAGTVPPYSGLHYQSGIPGPESAVIQPGVVDVGAYGMPSHPNDPYHPQPPYDHHIGHPQQPHFDQHQPGFMQPHSLHPVLDHSQPAHQQQSLGMAAPNDSHLQDSSLGHFGASSSQSDNAPTYDDLFPALPEQPEQTGNGQGGAWPLSGGPATLISNAPMHSVPATVAINPMPSNLIQQGRTSTQVPALKSTTITQIFRVPPEERKYRDLNRGLEQVEQTKICADIMAKTGTHIEISNSKDGTLTFLITGKEDAVQKAKRQIAAELQQEASGSVTIPKEYHRFILGKGGKKLSELEANTGTKIYVPRQNDDNSVIKIIGTRLV